MVQYLAQEFRIEVMDVLHDRGTGHWGGAASAAELLAAFYFDITVEILPKPEPDRAAAQAARYLLGKLNLKRDVSRRPT